MIRHSPDILTSLYVSCTICTIHIISTVLSVYATVPKNMKLDQNILYIFLEEMTLHLTAIVV